MKNFQRILGLILLVGMLKLAPYAYSWCFILPESITFGSSRDALNAGTAEQIKTTPELTDLVGGRVILANLYAIDSYDVTFQYDQGRNPYTVTIPKGHAIGLNDAKTQYFVIRVDPIAVGTLINPASDLWAKGNWPYWYTNMWSEVRGGNLGGYIRVTAVDVRLLPRNPVSVNISNIIRLGTEHYARTQDVPNAASEAPFSTAIFEEVPVVEECLDYCDTDGNDEPRPVVVTWKLKRNF